MIAIAFAYQVKMYLTIRHVVSNKLVDAIMVLVCSKSFAVEAGHLLEVNKDVSSLIWSLAYHCCTSMDTQPRLASVQVCKHPFTFSPVYAPDAPSRLPLWELLKGLVSKVTRGSRIVARLNLVLTVWLVIVPYATSWLWRLAFAKTWSMQEDLLPQLAPLQLLSDCLFGSFLSAGIVFTFLGATAIKEYVRQLQEPVLAADARQAEPEGVVAAFNAGLRDGQEGAGQQPVGPPENGVGPGHQGGGVPQAEGLQLLGAAAAGGAVAGGVLEVDNGAVEVPFEELIGMQGPIINLLENAITVLVSNALFLGAVVMVPFHVGRLVVLALEGSPVLRSGVARLQGLKGSFLVPEVMDKLAQVAASLREEASVVSNWSEPLVRSVTGGSNASSISALTSFLALGGEETWSKAVSNATAFGFTAAETGAHPENTSFAANASALGEIINATVRGNISEASNATSLLSTESPSTADLDVSNATTLFAGYSVLALGLCLWLTAWYGVKRWRGESVLHRQRGVGAVIAAAPEAGRQVRGGSLLVRSSRSVRSSRIQKWQMTCIWSVVTVILTRFARRPDWLF